MSDNAARDMDKATNLDKAGAALSGKRALVVGLASTGVSASRFLKKCGAVVTATDLRPASELPGAGALSSAGVEIVAGGHGGVRLEGLDIAVVSPGVPYDSPLLVEARKMGAKVISDIELAYLFIDAPVIAVAGTNGKSTTTTLLGKAIEDSGKKAFAGGNLGTPAIEYVEAGGGADWAVLEISSFHLETTEAFNPHIGILLNITEDHLDRYRDFGHYAETKFRLFENQTGADYAIVNAGDAVIRARLEGRGLGKGTVVRFSSSGELDEGLFLRGGSIVYRAGGREESYPTEGIKLKGLHNIENVMAVIAAARLAGVGRDSLLKTLASFEGLHHRMEFVRELDGVAYIDDSKGTNIGALEMALRGIKTPVVLIAGGRDKGGDYGVLKPLVREKVRCMILIGEARFKILESLGGLTESVMADTFEEAVGLARSRAVAGDTVLLCPACSSFDMFKSYRERGERFRALVEAL